MHCSLEDGAFVATATEVLHTETVAGVQQHFNCYTFKPKMDSLTGFSHLFCNQ